MLTGYPHRVHKRKAVVRFMFHNPDDICDMRWFRPLELWTKYGRHGRIRASPEPLGTYGTFKAAFQRLASARIFAPVVTILRGALLPPGAASVANTPSFGPARPCSCWRAPAAAKPRTLCSLFLT